MVACALRKAAERTLYVHLISLCNSGDKPLQRNQVKFNFVTGQLTVSVFVAYDVCVCVCVFAILRHTSNHGRAQARRNSVAPPHLVYFYTVPAFPLSLFLSRRCDVPTTLSLFLSLFLYLSTYLCLSFFLTHSRTIFLPQSLSILSFPPLRRRPSPTSSSVCVPGNWV